MNATLPGPLPDYWRQADDYPHHKVQLLSSSQTPTRLLTPTERATVRIENVPTVLDCPQGFSLLVEASCRLAIWQSKGILPYASGQWVATSLQHAMLDAHPRGLRYAWKGWDLLRQLDASDIGPEVWLSAEPDGDPFGPFRRVRLSARCEELMLESASQRG